MSDLVNGSSAQLVKYMRSSKLKFGFLSTYEWTIFIRRTGPCHFDMSLPIARDASNPSLRHCLLALGVLASRDWKFIEPPDFNIAQVSFRGSNSGNLLTSDPSSAFRRALHAKRPSVRPLSGTKSVPRRRYRTCLARRQSSTGAKTVLQQRS